MRSLSVGVIGLGLGHHHVAAYAQAAEVARLVVCDTDPARLEQVLTNLLRNAIRHTPPGGIVFVSAAEETRFVRIEVRDTGAGISSEDLPHIWERFYRGQDAIARESAPRGAGLGLALVKELVEAMDGTVEVKSTLGEGSCFAVRVPRASPDAKA